MTTRSRLAVPLLAALAACSSSRAPTPALRTLDVGPGPVYLAAGAARQLTATGAFADGTSAPVTSGLAWTSSAPAVATVSDAGLVTAVGAGQATVTATHGASGATASVQVTARAMTTLARGAQPGYGASGDSGPEQAYFRLTGLTPGAFYAATLGQLNDDLDLRIYADASLAEEAELCASETAGTADEACTAPANAQGELYVVVDGQWSDGGSSFVLDAVPATAAAVQGTLAFPAQLPLASSIGTGQALYEVTGLAPGGAYAIRLSGLTDDVDVEVYADPFQFTSLCASFLSGTADDACTARATAAGELYVEVDGESTAAGSRFTLGVAAAP